MTDSTDDVDWYDGYMDAPKRERKTKPLGATYRKFRHLGRVLRAGIDSEDPIHRAAAEMWVAIEKANASVRGGAAAPYPERSVGQEVNP